MKKVKNSVPKFSVGVWDFVAPPAFGELPLVLQNGDRYSLKFTCTLNGLTSTFGELYSVCCIPGAQRFYRERMIANAAVMVSSRDMYLLLEKFYNFFNEHPLSSISPVLQDELFSLVKKIRKDVY